MQFSLSFEIEGYILEESIDISLSQNFQYVCAEMNIKFVCVMSLLACIFSFTPSPESFLKLSDFLSTQSFL